MIIELKKIYGGLKNRKPQTLPELIEVINQFEWKGTGVTSGSVISVLTVLSQQGKNEAIKQFGKDKYYRVIRIANERGLGLIRGLENIEKKDLDQAQVIDIEDYRVKDTTVRKAYEFLLFGVQQ